MKLPESNIGRHITHEVGEPPRGWRVTALVPAPERESDEWVWLHIIGPEADIAALADRYRGLDLPFVIVDENPPGWRCGGMGACDVRLGDMWVALEPDE